MVGRRVADKPWEVLASRAYTAFQDSLPLLPGTVYRDADHPAEVLRAVLPADAVVYAWWGSKSSAMTGLSYAAYPAFVLWQDATGWYGLMVKESPNNRQGWDHGSWYFRAELLDRALADLQCGAEMLDLALRMADHDRLMFDQKAIGNGLLWGMREIMNQETLDAFETVTGLAGTPRPGRYACDRDRGLWIQQADYREYVVPALLED